MSYLEKYIKYKTKYLEIKKLLQDSTHGAEILAQVETNQETESSMPVNHTQNNSIKTYLKEESDSLSDLGRLTDTEEEQQVLQLDLQNQDKEQQQGGAKIDESSSSSSSSSKLSDSDSDTEDSV